MTYKEAVEYIKTEAGFQGMEAECLEWFEGLVTDARKFGTPINYLRLANDALYEWDV